MIARIATTFVGAVLIIYGVIAAISPLPLGVVLIALGFIMIAGANPAARPLIRRMRTRWRWFDRLVRLAAHRSPPRFKEVVKETEPPAHADEDTEPGKQTPPHGKRS